MRKYLSIIGLLVLSLASCTNDLENSQTGGEVTTINVSAQEFQTKTVTRTSISNTDYTVSWNDGDLIGIFPVKENAKQIAFEISGGSGSSNASFDGNGWGLKNGTEYVAYYPYYNNGIVPKENIPLDYTGQVQKGNDNTDHVGAFDYMYADASMPVGGVLNFQFQHLNALLKIQLPDDNIERCTGIELSTTGTAKFISKGTMDLSAASPQITPAETSSKLSVGYSHDTSDSKKVLTAYVALAPVDLSQNSLYVTLKHSSSSLDKTYSFTPQNFEAGKFYELKVIPYLTFTSSSLQTLKLEVSDQYYEIPSSLEYSVNGGAWNKLTTNAISFGGSLGELQLRGKSKSGTSYYDDESLEYGRIAFSTSAPVEASGDIRTLIDYDNYENCQTNMARFAHLFQNCTVLTSAPLLPATSLAGACYSYMFSGCSNLQEMPELPATQVPARAYEDMFSKCSSITEVKELSATSLAKNCYRSMFSGCVGLTTMPDLPAEKLYEYCYFAMFSGCKNLTTVKKLPATSFGPYCYRSMFSGCSSLVSVPADMLPNTYLSSSFCEGCYYHMFSDCTSLTNPPQLPATSLGMYSYYGMFSGCSSLKKGPDLPAIHVSGNGDFGYKCYDLMFENCSSLVYLKALFLGPLYQSSYTEIGSKIFYYTSNGLGNNGIFVKNINTTWTDLPYYATLKNWTAIYFDPETNKYYKNQDRTQECDENGKLL